ncbi:nitroreductase [Bacteroides caecigallinarum]|uniref:nitroreductase n=1 Tax=Bacteroides caecigallinarum TaxID=1411144 RepID=UPI001956793F|nr:nitroreductase [Bacteroides caecigallinarum]MBM6889494.1 nitroreductase [Bacteroides caecigallinarum]MCF2550518.1 nitroreductase [Bacteroides caecigallinarum]
MKTISRLFLIAGLASLSACTPSQKNMEAQEAASEGKNQVIETIMSRRSIRKYKQQPVEQEKLRQILECGINAPNGQNKQSWEIRVVNQEFISELDSLNRSLAIAKGADESKIRHTSYGAPVMIFIANDTTYDFSQVDCGLLGANMILTAKSLGLGSCCLGGIARTMKLPEAESLLKRLDLPENYNLLYAISFGYPDESPAAKPRKAEKIKFVE